MEQMRWLYTERLDVGGKGVKVKNGGVKGELWRENN